MEMIVLVIYVNSKSMMVERPCKMSSTLLTLKGATHVGGALLGVFVSSFASVLIFASSLPTMPFPFFSSSSSSSFSLLFTFSRLFPSTSYIFSYTPPTLDLSLPTRKKNNHTTSFTMVAQSASINDRRVTRSSTPTTTTTLTPSTKSYATRPSSQTIHPFSSSSSSAVTPTLPDAFAFLAVEASRPHQPTPAFKYDQPIHHTPCNGFGSRIKERKRRKRRIDVQPKRA